MPSRKSVTKWSDVLAVNCWVNLHSTWGWVASIVVAAAITVHAMGPRLASGREPLPKGLALCFVVLVAVMAAIWLLSLVSILLVASANFLRKGAIGPKSFTISADALTEVDGYRITTVPWRQVRSIDKTRRHILIRIGRWKFLLLPARDFQNEYQFAQYYADLVKAKHDST
jgi:hypothetical protein